MNLADRLLAALLSLAFAVLRALGPARASNLGGALARAIGPRLPVSAVARANLAAALPELSAQAKARIVVQVWDNLGRTVAELPNMDRIVRTASGPGFELSIHPAAAAAMTGHGVIYVAAHLANWEVLPSAARELPQTFGLFYRAAAAKAVDRVILRARQRGGGPALRQFAKGAKGGRQGLRHLRAGGAVGMLVDQKANDGLPIPLFGRPAMTSPSAAALSVRYGLPLLPTRVGRLGPARLRITVEPQPDCPSTGNAEADIAALTAAISARLESWIRARPGDWLWLHRRWPKA